MADVSTKAKVFQLQQEESLPCHDLMGGTSAMRLAGTRYVAQGAQTKEEFQDRLQRTVLLNVFRRTVNFLRGQVFQKPIAVGGQKDSLTEEVMTRFRDWAEDVDMQGKNLTAWSSSTFRQGLLDGVTFAVVDFSAIETRKNDVGVTEYLAADGTWKPKTQAADAAEAWRPYLVRVKADQVLDVWGSATKIEHFRYIETISVPDDAWSRKEVQQIRVFKLEGGAVVWETWRNAGVATGVLGTKSAPTGNFTLYQSGTLSLDVIPLVVFMPGDKRSDFTAEPALIDLAFLNIRHWQVASGHAELMEYVQRPVWFAAGIEMKTANGEKVPFGAGILLHSDDASAGLASVGVDSASYASSAAELKSLEDAMAMYGLQLLQPKSGAVTATESMRDSEENNSTLMHWALDFQDFLENIFRLVARWWGLEDGPSVSVNTDFSRAVDLAMLLDMYRAGMLSAEAVLLAARNAGLLPDDFDVEADAEKMARNIMVNGSATGVKSLASMLSI